MPELPEVETVVRGLARRLPGRRFARVDLHRADLRAPLPPGLKAKLEGRFIERIDRRGKYILIHCDDGGVILAHLGMSGRMVLHDPGDGWRRAKHDHVVFTLDDGTILSFNDARRFGTLDHIDAAALDGHKLLRHMGPEPLGNSFNGPNLARALAGKKTSIKAALLDQRIVAGLGNIYVCESLYWAGLSPRRLAGTVQGARAEALARAIRETLRRAIAAGGSSLRDYVQTSGELGYFQHQWAVYGKQGGTCPRCAEAGKSACIKRIVQSARSTFYCARCQR